MPVLPYHKYIGPGNKLNNGKPVDDDDLIAWIHDHAYAKASQRKDIEKADDEAINDFLGNYFDTNNIHSLIGAGGLGIKRIAEKIVGPLYPDTPPKNPPMPANPKRTKDQQIRSNIHKRQDQGQRPAGAARQLDMNDSNNAMEENSGEQQQAPGSSGQGNTAGTTNSGNPNAGAIMFYGDGRLNPKKFTFTHRRMMCATPYVTRILNQTRRVFYQELFTGHAVIPVDQWYWYMNQAEWDSLPLGCYCEKVYTNATSMGQRLAFRTNETGSSTANSQCTTFASYTIGLNCITPFRKMQVETTEDKEPMVPSALKPTDHQTWMGRLWGPSNTHATDIGCGMGAYRQLVDYAVLCASQTPNGTGWFLNPIELNKFENMYAVENTEGFKITDYSYSPKVSHLKTSPNFTPSYLDASTGSINQYTFDGKANGNFRLSRQGNNLSNSYSNPHLQMRCPPGTIQVAFFDRIEQASYRDTHFNSEKTGTIQPSFTIQYKPIQQNVVGDVTASWASGNYFINFDTEIDIIWDPNAVCQQVKSRVDMDPIEDMVMNDYTRQALAQGTFTFANQGNDYIEPYVMHGRPAGASKWSNVGGTDLVSLSHPMYEQWSAYMGTRSGANKPPPGENVEAPVPPSSKRPKPYSK